MSQILTKEIAAARGVNLDKLPAHIGIIMDGNGRWAKKRLLPRVVGHRYGAQKAHEIFKFAGHLGVKAITLYTFSQENWSRPAYEIRGLMKIFSEFLERYAKEIIETGMRFNVIGDLSGFPVELVNYIRSLEEKTKHQDSTCLTLALGYGSRSEIVRACKSIARDVKAGHLDPADIDESLFANRLQTADLPEMDFVIRTSGELRVSNFLLWQIAYAELFFTEKLWPDFSTEDFMDAIIDFQSRDRRFGAVRETDPVDESLAVENSPICSSSEF